MAFVPAVISSAVPASGLERLKRVSDRFYFFQGDFGNPNSGVIVTPGGLVVIDAQWSTAAAADFLREIREVSDRPVRFLVYTHAHADHVSGAHALARGATVVASASTVREMEKRGREMVDALKERTRNQADDLPLVLPALTFSVRAALRIGGVDVVLIDAGRGHSWGDTAVFLPDEGILYAADLVTTNRFPWIRDSSSREWLAALSRLSAETGGPVERVFPGHGEPGGSASIEKTKRLLESIRREVGAALDAGLSTFEAQRAIRLPEFSSLDNYEFRLPPAVGRVYEEMEAEKEGIAPGHSE
ncbi:MAG: MBL fold metallo-hydrolase [Nitrospirae bacterium]|nr:MBL fold metallo-hydrolase [Nitrospirota bacterium]